jgi:hypothetical protein
MLLPPEPPTLAPPAHVLNCDECEEEHTDDVSVWSDPDEIVETWDCVCGRSNELRTAIDDYYFEG